MGSGTKLGGCLRVFVPTSEADVAKVKCLHPTLSRREM